MTISERQITQAARQRQLATPPADCMYCGGSGFYDLVDPLTGEIFPVLCGHTMNCKRHAERALKWAELSTMKWFVDIATEAWSE